MQMVFQSPRDSFDPRKTIGYSIGESLWNQKIAPDRRQEQVRSLLDAACLRRGKTVIPTSSVGDSASGPPSPGP